MANRKCTDILCLLIFFVATGGMGYLGFYSYTNGDPSLIMAPMDADGNSCGKSVGYENYPLLWFQEIDTFWLAYGVCVQACPSATDTNVACIGTANVSAPGNIC